jgi:radical SAM protein with 4Fe4S-binding SPASM domain
LGFAKQGIKDFFAVSSSRHIRYFGAGEPTLEFEKMKAIRNFAYDLAGEQLRVELQTNGLYSSEIAKWIADNVNIIWFSYDGTPDIHDLQRPTHGGYGTANIIERNIKFLTQNGKNIIVGTRPTITPLNINRQIEMIEYFYSLGVRAVFSDPVFPPVEEKIGKVNQILNVDESFNLQYAQKYVKAKKRADQLGIFYGSILTINFDEETELFCRACIPSPHLTTDGHVTSCDMSYLGDTLPELIYGKYLPDQGKIEYFPEKIKLIRLRRASNLKACKGCEVLFNCAGACFGEGVNETGIILGVKKNYCDAIKYLAKNLPRNNGLDPYLHP